MNKTTLMDALQLVARERRDECARRIAALPREAVHERAALAIQKQLYDLGITIVGYSGREEGITPFCARRLEGLLASEDALRAIYGQAEGEDKVALAVYLHTVLFWKQNFLLRFRDECARADRAEAKFEASVKLSTIEELLGACRACYEGLGGRKGLVIV